MRLLSSIISCSLAIALAITLTPATAWATGEYTDEQKVLGVTEGIHALAETPSLPNVTTHTQAEIIAWVKAHPFDTKKERGYATKPKLKAPYAAGKPSKTNLQEGLNALNAMRYIAGLDANVTLDETYNELAQAAALVNYVNGGLSHSPSQPKGMSKALYDKGYKGSSSSNLSSGIHSIPASVLAFMDDSSGFGTLTLGHRRWLLNPSMGKTGLGFVSWRVAIYAFDSSNANAAQSNVVWPAQNMPLEYFNESQAWSVSTGETLDASKVAVTLTRKSDGKTWKFSKAKSDGSFLVNNSNYGQRGCVIFRPKNLAEIKSGDRFRVKVTGIPRELDYTVNFFEIRPSIEHAAITVASATYTGKALKPKVTVKSNGKTLRKGTDYKISSTDASIGWNEIIVSGIGNYNGKKVCLFRVKPKKPSLSKITTSKRSFTAKWKNTARNQQREIDGYQVRYSTNSKMKNSKVKTVKDSFKTSLKVSGLKKGKKYYVQVRAYVSGYDNEKGKTVKLYSAWSKTKSVKVK